MTALLLVSVEPEMARANALKNMLVGAATVVSAATLIVLGHVDWAAATELGGGSFLGSTIGPLVRGGFRPVFSAGSWPSSGWA